MLLGVVAAVAVAALLLQQQQQTDWTVVRPSFTTRVAALPPDVDETSGVVASGRTPGLFWTILDSGNPAELIGLDSAGNVRGRVPLAGAVNTDWEAVATGPCRDAWCVYVGDIGDNLGRRDGVTLLRVPEPGDAALRAGAAVRPSVLHFRFPEGPRDAEALVVTPAGDAVVVTKGLASPVRAYRLRASAWGRTDTVTAEPLGPLPIEPRSAIGRWVTDASLAPDGRRVAIRTYRDVFFFELAADGTLRPGRPPTLCDISGLEAQGEGVAWANDTVLVLTSEASRGGPAVVHRVGC